MKLHQIAPNMTEVITNDGKTIFYSYEEPVGAIIDGKFYRTDKKWSQTTSVHLNKWLKSYGDAMEGVETKPQEFFDKLAYYKQKAQEEGNKPEPPKRTPRYKQVEIFKYNEAPPELQEKILEKYRYINVEDDFWYEGEIDYWKEELAKKGFIGAHIAFSGFWNQGDGASFTCDEIDLVGKISKQSEYSKYKALVPFIEDGYISASIERISSYYSHANTVKANVESRGEETDQYGKLINELEIDLTEEVRDLSEEIYRALNKLYDSYISDEAVIDTLEANDYDFDEFGKIASYNTKLLHATRSVIGATKTMLRF